MLRRLARGFHTASLLSRRSSVFGQLCAPMQSNARFRYDLALACSASWHSRTLPTSLCLRPPAQSRAKTRDEFLCSPASRAGTRETFRRVCAYVQRPYLRFLVRRSPQLRWPPDHEATCSSKSGTIREDGGANQLITGLVKVTTLFAHITAGALGATAEGLVAGLLDIYGPYESPEHGDSQDVQERPDSESPTA